MSALPARSGLESEILKNVSSVAARGMIRAFDRREDIVGKFTRRTGEDQFGLGLKVSDFLGLFARQRGIPLQP